MSQLDAALLFGSAGLTGALVGAVLPWATRLLAVPTGPSARTMKAAKDAPSGGRQRLAASPCVAVSGWPLGSVSLAVTSIGIGLRLRSAELSGPATLAVWLVILYSGALLAAVDIAVRRLPTPVIAVAAAAVFVILAAEAAMTADGRRLVIAAAAGAALGGGYLLLALLGGSGMGLGDVRLAALLGTALGTLGWNAVLLGAVLPYLLAAPAALAHLASRVEGSMAFGPYLVAGALIALVLIA
ncbi:prepilin peptidase [Micromonospora sediminicola]|uniref:prepilin peptidase n=1 Tax=Micromonospora sediminicola TaxID=946078 RepID=UPI0033A6E830